ncbi:MAG: helix-turn-helix transcriptional regulator [Solirubrobacteraceae bacterium]|nr:helix-turn-helix transcriptional regulator [Solirubrobacteraceae bacterium]
MFSASCSIVTMSTPVERPLRRDAERNRRRILAAARTVFAERGLDVSMDEIARAAGVGVGTVYRRFPDRDQLVSALFEDEMNGVIGLAQRCLALDDPWEGVVTFLEEMCHRAAADRGLKQLLLSTGRARCEIERTRDALHPLVTELVDRAQAAGVLRDDLVATDILLMQVAIGGVMDWAGDVAPDVWARVLGILLDGLRPRRDAAEPLPGPALGADEVLRAMHEHRVGRG